MTTAIDTSLLQRAKVLQSPLVRELCSYIDDLLEQRKAQEDAYALLSDANADLQKDNRALRAELATARQDAEDARHDTNTTLSELNRREDGGVPYRF